ncbi:toprim domain-containing protein [Phenylobacterium sp.]|jgi:hypothetical protein|uniref:toprim domain-containing protein n=1 Tax=Phenylobacterium sp. TaxID=1871053 RepID=UPI002E328144|nr:toprim domain-containing protein [Phenylobacterium sp.]HEX2562013.1 toprim domain-containing protein [Phenylobacterium sp.]
MTLRAIVAALGGELYAGGRRASVPAPGHSPADRSVSLLLSDGRVIAHGFGAADWRAVLDDLRARGLIDADARPVGGAAAAGGPPPVSGPERRAAARALWESGHAVRPGSPADLYARRRAVGRPLRQIPVLRAHAAAPLAVYRPGPSTRPALVAAVTAEDGSLTGVEVTYLTPNGQRAQELRLPRKLVGAAPPGAAVRLDPADERLLVAEGVFTALSAGERFGLPAWALLGAGGLARWTAPAGVRRVLIAADRGRVGEKAAWRLARRLRGSGVEAEVRLPPRPHGDWNDLAQEERRKGGTGRPGPAG